MFGLALVLLFMSSHQYVNYPSKQPEVERFFICVHGDSVSLLPHVGVTKECLLFAQ